MHTVAGAPFLSDTPTMTGGSSVASAVSPPRLEPGSQFGQYRIERLLGKGGMGEVYEAEHVEQQRRVALKILSQGLQSREDRERFLSEGRLAASISHPHTVYVFGSEEIAGVPTIAMELVPGGTLKDRVAANGPLPVRDAVDAILQVIAGLEAVHARGLLHRDVKPANCFVEVDGTVKVGDFGLSMSARIGHPNPNEVGLILGTPAFAPPEQLQGNALDVRTDIYAVGATLFYLLTGRPPFDDTDLATVITRAIQDPAPSPRQWRADVPKRLAGVVATCLAKAPAARSASYTALAGALAPFGSQANVPAPLGLRSLAYVIDRMVLTGLLMVLHRLITVAGGQRVSTFRSLADDAFMILYFGVTEGWFGASAGKVACRLRVVRSDSGVPDVGRAILRAAAIILVFDAATAFTPALSSGPAEALMMAFALAALFSSARTRNRFAAVHELVSGTRTIHTAADTGRDAEAVEAEPPGRLPGRIGPYALDVDLDAISLPALVGGYDPLLRRRVWVQVAGNTTPPLPAARRAVRRRTRVQWLNGGSWRGVRYEVYEAPGGRTFAGSIASLQRRRWPIVRDWLGSLADEIAAGVSDGTLDALSLDRIWIDQRGHARLLDWGAPGDEGRRSTAVSCSPDLNGAQQFLAAVASSALAAEKLPLRVTGTLTSLANHAFLSARDMVQAVEHLQAVPVEIARGPRIAQVTLAATGVIGWQLWIDNASSRFPQVVPMLAALAALAFLAASTRGGLGLRLIGAAIVTADGREASRTRAASRAAVLWAPIVALTSPSLLLMGSWIDVIMGRRVPIQQVVTLGTVTIAVLFTAWVVYARTAGGRDWHDRLAGTWVVPR